MYLHSFRLALCLAVLLACLVSCAGKQTAAQPSLPGQLELHGQGAAATQSQAKPAPAQSQAKPEAAQTNATESADTFSDDFNQPTPVVSDPFYGWNKVWFHFNDGLYTVLWRPVGKAYRTVAPSQLRVGIRNVFHNALFPVRFINCLLQGKFKGAGVEMARFIGNTAFGGLGLSDAFNKMEAVADPGEADFGQTLAVWGLNSGPYIVWPVLGPSTLRDSFGLAGDMALDPLSYLGAVGAPWYVGAGIKQYRGFNQLSFDLDSYDSFKDSVIEPYSSMRNAYIQHRAEELKR